MCVAVPPAPDDTETIRRVTLEDVMRMFMPLATTLAAHFLVLGQVGFSTDQAMQFTLALQQHYLDQGSSGAPVAGPRL